MQNKNNNIEEIPLLSSSQTDDSRQICNANPTYDSTYSKTIQRFKSVQNITNFKPTLIQIAL